MSTKLKDLLLERRGVPFPFIDVDMNKDGKVDKSDIVRRERRRKAVIKALQNRMMTVHEDIGPPPEDDVVTDDHEGTMAKADLLAIHKKAGELYNMVSEEEELEGWVQSKITKAADYINAVHNHMMYEKNKPMSIGSGVGAPADGAPTVNESLVEEAPTGWEATIKKMKKKKEIDNPWALAHWMKAKGYTPKEK